MSDTFLYILLVVGFVALWAGIWLSVSFLAGRVSGWQKLATIYPDTASQQQGEKKRWLYIRFGKTRYNGAVVFEALPIGLRISSIWLFRFGQPSMIIPWNEIGEPEKLNVGTWDYIYTNQFTIQKAEYPIICTLETAEWVMNKKKEFFV